MSNQASHSNKTLVIVDAGTTIKRCFHRAQAVTVRQQNSATSKKVHASRQLLAT